MVLQGSDYQWQGTAMCMAVGRTMNNSSCTRREGDHGVHEQEKDDHENDLVMPGFRFHPTEEELIEFYLRRKVEGKRFNVELITFLDLYRYDPWELPGEICTHIYIYIFHFRL